VAETEDIGLETLGELERNREKIEGTREKVRKRLHNVMGLGSCSGSESGSDSGSLFRLKMHSPPSSIFCFISLCFYVLMSMSFVSLSLCPLCLCVFVSLCLYIFKSFMSLYLSQNQEFTAITEDADKRLKSMWFRQKTWGLFG
jgi:hypothetical protein